MRKEVWRDILGYENKYQVSNYGNIKSLNFLHTKKPKIMKVNYFRTGYAYVELHKNGISKKHSIHRLVAIAFIDKDKERPFTNHKNGIKSDNNVENLEWCNRSENQLHAFRNGLQETPRGSKNGTSYLTEKQIVEIRTLYRNGGITQQKLAVMFKTSQMNISNIILRKRWKHI